jgi:hypothetical protein
MILVNHRAGCDGALCENDHDSFFRLLALGRLREKQRAVRIDKSLSSESQQWIRSQIARSFTMSIPGAQPSLTNIGNASFSSGRTEKLAK